MVLISDSQCEGRNPTIHQQYGCDWRKEETRPLSRVSALGSLQCFDTRAVQRLIFITARRHASAVYAVVVCLSQVGALLKQLNAGSCKQCHSGPGTPRFLMPKILAKLKWGIMVTPNGGAKCRWARFNLATFDKPLAITRKRRPLQVLST